MKPNTPHFEMKLAQEVDRLKGHAQAQARELERRAKTNAELLTALKEARSELEEYCSLLDGEDYNSLAINAAIAKAEAQ